MERLTDKIDGHYFAKQRRLNDGTFAGGKACMQKLGKLEDLEEQGLLLKLPCKVGDVVYCFWTVYDFHMDEISTDIIEEKFEVAMIDDIGKTVFLTKAEAEKALAEMEK